jgi:hypothetical protein
MPRLMVFRFQLDRFILSAERREDNSPIVPGLVVIGFKLDRFIEAN